MEGSLRAATRDDKPDGEPRYRVERVVVADRPLEAVRDSLIGLTGRNDIGETGVDGIVLVDEEILTRDTLQYYGANVGSILGCGGLAVTTPALSVARYFKEYCHIVSCEEEARELFGRLKNGLAPCDRLMSAAGAEYVLKEHTWAHRLEEIMKVISCRQESADLCRVMVGGSRA